MKTLYNIIIHKACVVALLLIITLQAFAQNDYNRAVQNRILNNILSPKFEIGVRLMPAYSTFWPQTSSGIAVKGDAIAGYGVSALFGYYFNSHFGLQTELNFTSTGRSYTDNGIEKQVNLNYINIPLLISLNTNKYKRVNFNVVVGPQLGILTGYSLNSSVRGGEGSGVAILSARKNDFGIAYGTGVDFGLNHARTIRLGLGFRGSYSLIDIGNTNYSLINNSYNVLNGTQLQTYYLYTGLSVLF